MMKGDHFRLQQIMINLIKNSIKFTNQGEIFIQFWYDRVERLLHVTVKDTGIGIQKEDMD
jgi:signal transduction histidine kinase